MKLYRILSMLLCLMLIFGAVSVSTFAEEAEVEVYGSESIGILSVLGIAEIPAEELNDYITRADFLKIIGTAVGYGQMKSEEVIFSDIPLEDEREPYIKALYKMGLVAPDKDGKLYPDAKISVEEAAAIAVKVTGYSIVAETKGGYPSGYLNVAKMCGVLRGIPMEHKTVVTKGIAARLTENILRADLMIQTGFGNKITYEEGSSETLLTAIYDVKCVEAVLEGVDLSRITGDNDIEPFFCEIGGLKIDITDVADVYDYLGYNVKAYYREERADIPRLIYVEKTNKNNEIVIDIDDISKISGYKIRAYDNTNKVKSYSYKRGIPVIYNGVSTGKVLSQTMITGKNGKIRLLDNDGDGAYDLVFVDVYETFIVSEVDMADSIVYDRIEKTVNENTGKKENKIKSICLDVTTDDPYTVIFDESGEETNFGSIKKGMVLSVFVSASDAPQQYQRAYIINKTATGRIEQIKEGGKKLVIDDEEYEVNAVCQTSYSELLNVGSSVKLTLDYGGKVVYVENVEEDEAEEVVYGFLAKVGSSVSRMNLVLKMKIYTLNNRFEIFEIADSLKIDGKKFKKDNPQILTILRNASNTQFPGSTEYSSMIRYKTDLAGKISMIDTVLNGTTGAERTRYELTDSEDAMFVASSVATDYCSTGRRIVGPNIAYNSNALLFVHPSPLIQDVNNEDFYIIDNANSILAHDTPYAITGYYTENVMNTDFMSAIYDENQILKILPNSKFSIIDEVYEGLDEKTGDVIKYVKLLSIDEKLDIPVSGNVIITGADGTSDPNISATMTVDELKRGDVVTYFAPSDGYLKKLCLWFRTSTKTEVNAGNVFKKAFRGNSLKYAIVYDKFEDGMLLYVVDTPAELDKSVLASKSERDCELFVLTGATPAFYSYEEWRKGEMVVKNTSMDNLKSYVEAGLECSTILLHQVNGQPISVVEFE